MLVVAPTAALAACSDGRPAFCTDLRRAAGMSALTGALQSQNLARARTEARAFRDLADRAPGGVRADLRDLAGAVSDIVALISEERGAVLGAEGGSGTDARRGDTPGAEQDRDELNARLGDLALVSSRVQRWAQRNCGLTLR